MLWKRPKALTKFLVKPEEVVTDRTASPRLTESLREALCTLLEIAACLDELDMGNRKLLVTVCTARILGCLKRFVAGCIGMEPPLGACCGCKCEQRLLHLTLLSILIRMCREPEIACNVVKENLHRFLIQMCAPSEAQIPRLTVASEAVDSGVFDPYDLMVLIDPFDWCYQPVCTRLAKEKAAEFLAPMGIRSLICLLRGLAIPTDEVSEFEQQIRVNRTVREKSPRRRKLPSIFAFPQAETVGSARAPKCRLAPLCVGDTATRLEQHETRALWILVLNEGSRVHLALRSLIALAIHLPKLSLEYKALQLERDYVRRIMANICLTSSYHKLESVLSGVHASDSVEPLPFQLIAIHPSTLQRIATAALVVFAEEQHADPSSAIPKTRVIAGERRALHPITRTRQEFTKGAKERKPLSILHRLDAATYAASTEFSRWEKEYAPRRQSPELERNRRRLAIRQTCADVERLRSHLVGSLEVLCSGRQHPDPEQSFSQWIKSLPTLDTLERERQYQQEMRQRQVLEQQYQREVSRRRERDECTQMHANDFNVPEESELSVQQARHERFLQMRAEMRQLEQRDSDDDAAKGPTEESTAVGTLTKKEKLAMQERQRLLHLEAQRREARELEKMRREDLYYVERILAAKAKAKEEHEKLKNSGDLKKNALEEQQKHIARMRLLDEEKRLAERESSSMRVEDLFGRQLRFREAEKAKEELRNEWRERKAMQAEEHDCRSRWILWDRALLQQEQEELRQQRAQARRLKREQEREERELRAAWVASWDDNGNLYYYNTLTGTSQWEAPA
jgi:hypothetical protein